MAYNKIQLPKDNLYEFLFLELTGNPISIGSNEFFESISKREARLFLDWCLEIKDDRKQEVSRLAKDLHLELSSTSLAQINSSLDEMLRRNCQKEINTFLLDTEWLNEVPEKVVVVDSNRFPGYKKTFSRVTRSLMFDVGLFFGDFLMEHFEVYKWSVDPSKSRAWEWFQNPVIRHVSRKAKEPFSSFSPWLPCRSTMHHEYKVSVEKAHLDYSNFFQVYFDSMKRVLG